MEEAVLRVETLEKTYGTYAALKDVSFSLEKGDILGIIGENGAGKSTLLSLLALIQKPTRGAIYFTGADVTKNKREYRAHIGYVPQEIALFEELSGKENLLFFAKSYGLKKEAVTERLNRICEITEFPEEWLMKPVAQYSGGMKRKINIAAALLHEPQILLLDEPAANLDFEAEEQVNGVIRRLAENGTTVLYVGHQLDQMETLCNKLCLLREGSVIAFGTTEELLGVSGQRISLKQFWRTGRSTISEKE